MIIKLTNSGDHVCKRELRSYRPCLEATHDLKEIQYLRRFQHRHIIKLFDSKFISLPPYHYLHITTSISLPPYHYLHITTFISLPPYHYFHITTSISLPPYHYLHITTSISLPPYHYLHITTSISLPLQSFGDVIY